LPTQRKIVLKKFPNASKKIKIHQHTARQTQQTMTQKLNIYKAYSEIKKEGQQVTAPKKNWRLGVSYDSFVVEQTLVLRMNICGENRQLLLAANRQTV